MAVPLAAAGAILLMMDGKEASNKLNATKYTVNENTMPQK
jgi:hypothetical protein